MQITGYRTLTTCFPWGRSIGDANGHLVDAVTDVPIVILETDVGLEGIGIGSHAALDRLFPAIEGEDPRTVSALFDRMLAQVFKAGHAGSTYGGIGTLDSALWDLKAKAAGEPLWRMLGGRDRFVPGYASGLDIALDDDALHAFYSGYAERGFAAGKLKGGRDLAADVRRLGIVRDALSGRSAQPGLMIDANESWQPKQAVRHIAALEQQYDLLWVEEPLRRWDAGGHARLSAAIRAAVATGENLTGVDQFKPFFEAGAPDIVQVGAGWGVTHFQRTALAAHLHDRPISIVGHNSNPAVAHATTAVPNHLTTEVQALHTAPGIEVDQQVVDGGIVLGDQPGAGITIDASLINSSTGSGWTDPAGPHRRPERAGLRLLLDEAAF